MHTLELAKADEAELCNQIIARAGSFSGNRALSSGRRTTRNIDTIRGDVADGTGYVLRVRA